MSTETTNDVLNVIVVILVSAGALAWVVDVAHRVLERMRDRTASRARRNMIYNAKALRASVGDGTELERRVRKLEQDGAAHGTGLASHWEVPSDTR